MGRNEMDCLRQLCGILILVFGDFLVKMFQIDWDNLISLDNLITVTKVLFRRLSVPNNKDAVLE